MRAYRIYVSIGLGICAWADAPVSELHRQGLAQYEQKNYKEAIAALEQAVKSEDPKSPEFLEATRDIGQSYFALGQPAKAILWLERTAPAPEVHYMLGQAHLQLRDVDRAEIAFARLFGVPAHSAASHILTAELMLKREQESEAQAQIEKALALDARIPMAHYMLGEIAIYQGRVDDGIAEMGKELELNPNHAMAWYRLGEALSRQERWQSAIPNLERAIWLNADISGPYIVLGKCYYKMADYANAEAMLKRALKLDPANYSATYLLGQTLMANGKKEEGRAVLDKLKGMERR